MREFHISKKDAKKLILEIKKQLKIQFNEVKEKGNKVVELEKNVQIFLLDKVIIIKKDETVFPALICDEKFLNQFPYVKVDKEAISHICKGAKVMRPGIVCFEGEFEKGDIVCIKEADHSKFIMIGKALMGKIDAEKSSKGVIFNNLHYVGDRYWKILKDLKT
ncbi:MAG: PUA domain-containing protein [Nitrososphaeria archaeon]